VKKLECGEVPADVDQAVIMFDDPFIPTAELLAEHLGYWVDKIEAAGLTTDLKGAVPGVLASRLRIAEELLGDYDALLAQGEIDFRNEELSEFEIASSALATSWCMRQQPASMLVENRRIALQARDTNTNFDPGEKTLRWHVRHGHEHLLVAEYTAPGDGEEVWYEDENFYVQTFPGITPSPKFLRSYRGFYGKEATFDHAEFTTMIPVLKRSKPEAAL
jgi:hypothetical protein